MLAFALASGVTLYNAHRPIFIDLAMSIALVTSDMRSPLPGAVNSFHPFFSRRSIANCPPYPKLTSLIIAIFLIGILDRAVNGPSFNSANLCKLTAFPRRPELPNAIIRMESTYKGASDYTVFEPLR